MIVEPGVGLGSKNGKGGDLGFMGIGSGFGLGLGVGLEDENSFAAFDADAVMLMPEGRFLSLSTAAAETVEAAVLPFRIMLG